MCAGDFPGEAPQKTQITVLGVPFSGRGVEGAVVERMLEGLGLVRPFTGGVELPECVEGVAPPEAMIEVVVA